MRDHPRQKKTAVADSLIPQAGDFGYAEARPSAPHSSNHAVNGFGQLQG
jgi:hypothetical protein